MSCKLQAEPQSQLPRYLTVIINITKTTQHLVPNSWQILQESLDIQSLLSSSCIFLVFAFCLVHILLCIQLSSVQLLSDLIFVSSMEYPVEGQIRLANIIFGGVKRNYLCIGDITICVDAAADVSILLSDSLGLYCYVSDVGASSAAPGVIFVVLANNYRFKPNLQMR
jgi:hypothetical protein